MTVDGCPKVAKYILIAFNALVLLAGLVAIGLGAWTLASSNGADRLREITGSELYHAASIAIIVGGCIIVVLAFLGCCGSLKENRVLLGIYFTIMLLFLILFVVAAVLAFVYKDDLKTEVGKQMEDTLVNKYGVNVANNDGNQAATGAWNEIQKNFQCCGVEGGLGSSKSWYLWQSSAWYKNQTGAFATKNLVPESCCRTTNFTKCQKQNIIPTQPAQNYTQVTEENVHMYSTGCVDKMMSELENHIGAIAGIAVAVLVVLLLSVIFSVCVCTSIGHGSMVV